MMLLVNRLTLIVPLAIPQVCTCARCFCFSFDIY